MGPLEDADELKAVASDFGLRVHDLRINHPSDKRFVIALGEDVDVDKIYVHASPVKLTISLDLTDGTSHSLTYEETLERLLEEIGA